MSTRSKWLTPAAYARHRGVSKQAVSKAIRQGRITLGKDGKLDPRVADAAWSRSTVTQVRPRSRPTKGQPRAKGAPDAGQEPARIGPTYADARADRESFLAKLAELDYRRRSGELLEAEAVRAEVFRLGRRARDMLLALPERLAPRLAAGLDAGEAHRILREEVERVANEIAAGARAL